MASKLKDVAYQYVRNKLMSGDFTEGRGLSSQTIGKELGISRTPVREALSQLEREGLLESVPRSGTYHRQLTREEIGDLYELRAAVEAVAAAQAALRRNSAHLHAMGKCCRQFDRRVSALQKSASPGVHDPELTQTDMQFHGLVFAAAANRFAKDAFETMHLQTALLSVNLKLLKPPKGRAALPPEELKKIARRAVRRDSFAAFAESPFRDVLFNTVALGRLSAGQHSAIYQAIRAADAKEAADLMRKHLKYAQLITRARLQVLEESGLDSIA